MADNRQYVALEWVIKDIKNTLLQARSALEVYAQESADIVQLKFCITYIHQVYGGLHMAGFYGAAMIASEIESLIKELLADNVSNIKEAVQVLKKSIHCLPDYLEQTIETRSDQPRVVFSLLNELRAVRGANFLSEATIFAPDFSSLDNIVFEPNAIVRDTDQFSAVLSKLRQMYQYAAASVIHKNNTEENLQYLAKVSERLQKVLKGTKRAPVWEIASAFIIGLRENLIPDDAAIKNLLRQLDEEIKLLITCDFSVLQEVTSENLLKNLLYYLLPFESVSPVIDAVYRQYNLANAALISDLEKDDARPINPSAIHAVTAAVMEELSEVKVLLNNCYDFNSFMGGVTAANLSLHRVADTLAILGVGDLRQNILEQMQSLENLRMNSSADFSKEAVSPIIDAIKDLEKNIGSVLIGSQYVPEMSVRQFSQDEKYALQESRNDLEEAKDMVVNYIATQWDMKILNPLSDILRKASSSLDFLSLDLPSDMLKSCASYIDLKLVDQRDNAKWTQLDSLVDIIAGVDYFLEVLSMTQEEDIEILQSAKKGLVDLGVPITKVEDIFSSSTQLSDSKSNQEISKEQDKGQGNANQKIIQESDDAISSEVEAEIIDIFIEEAEEVVDSIREFLPQWVNNITINEPLVEVRRSFHTLKGSGRLVKANHIGELAWSIENMLNRILDKTLKPESYHVELVNKVTDFLPEMIVAFKHQQEASIKSLGEQYQHWAHQLAAGDVPEDFLAPSNTVDLLLEDEDEVDPQLWEIFGSEAEVHLTVIRESIQRIEAVQPFFEPPSDAMQRSMHTLKGSAHMAEIKPIANLMTPMELFVKDLRAYQVSIDEDILQLLKDSVSYTEDALEQMSGLIYPNIKKLDLFLARVAELRERAVGHLINHDDDSNEPKVDPTILENLMNEGMHLLLDIDVYLEQWPMSPSKEEWQLVEQELSMVEHAAERSNLAPMELLSHHLKEVYKRLIVETLQPSDDVYSALTDGHFELLNIIDAIAAGQDLPEPNYQKLTILLDDVNAENVNGVHGGDVEFKERDLAGSVDPIDTALKQNHIDLGVAAEAASNEGVEDDTDDEIVAIFVDEAKELIEEQDRVIADWEQGGNARENNEALQRTLHTFKGGARLSGLSQLGDYAHEFESYLINNMQSITSPDLLANIHHYQDQLIKYVDALSLGEALPEFTMLQDDLAPEGAPEIVEEKSQVDSPENIDNVVAFLPQNSPDAMPAAFTSSPVPIAPVNDGNAARRVAPQENVRVSSDLMEELVNLAGETSISRGRIEENISELGESLEEMDQTVERLQEQIRRLDIETEAQVLFRQEQLGDEDDFDPLEMDRYSHLQQLSRSLIESASDLRDLKSTLANKARDAETVLLQQSRINTELQEGLMRSRMVPFSRIVPRLRRIVRQISAELGKDVNFECNDAEGELDRNMMERIVPSLEHMLRNAVDHGIEDALAREQVGKPKEGRIVLSLSREGGDVLLSLSDDGAGVNVDRVRQKAIELQLMDVDVELTDQEVMQFIFHAGFSTAQELTQISGRGVGMDVVNSEIKQLGGSIDIRSSLGQGTQFLMRLPFTLSVNRALIISIGEDRYAIPLNAIGGIARIPYQDLPEYYNDPNKRFDYAGEKYQVQYLGSLLNKNMQPKLEGYDMPIPVLLVQSGSLSVALQVDALQGSREIVVKSLGAQFSAVQGLSGATIMGDGHVVVILDVYAMIRQQQVSVNEPFILSQEPQELQEDVHSNPLVMVVDDSVTVRKVTTRFLEREGFDVITAKDGLDAMTILQDRRPDIMLLDIEMPRMDGFEVARRIRMTAATKELPIIMITSRTGEKHRQTGLDAGANEYMGKPYQEDVLLANIHYLLHAVSQS